MATKSSEKLDLQKRSKMATRAKKISNENKRESGRNTENEEDVCGSCKMIVTEDENAVACEICERWYHIKCEDLPETVYKFMGTEGGNQVMWYCSYCSRGCVKIYNRLKKLELKHEDIGTRQCVLEEEFSEVKEGIEKQMSDFNARHDLLKEEMVIVKEAASENKEHVEAFESRLGLMEAKFIDLQQGMTSVKNDLVKEKNSEKTYSEALLVEAEKKAEEKCKEVKKGIEKVLVEKTTRHMQRRLDRKNNIVLHGAPEEVKKDLNLWLRGEKIKHDKAILMELCLEIDVECYVDDIVDIKRVGKFKKNADSTSEDVVHRPIIATLKEGIKEKILRNVYKLKKTENAMLKRMRVSHDMTQEERQIDKELRLEAKKKNEEETENFFYVVRGNPWERSILKLKSRKKETTGTSAVLQTQESAEPKAQMEGGGD